MNHKEKLLQVYKQATNAEDIKSEIPDTYKDFISKIANNCTRLKGVYTVLITLLVHKTLNPDQDIRFHQAQIGGFSGRNIDKQYITPTLQELGLPAMAESGWLTRSLEQPKPYTLDYPGKIGNKSVKEAFLNLIDWVQKNPDKAELVLRILLGQVIQNTNFTKIEITKIENNARLNIKLIVNSLEEHFNFNYKTHGASKLPVLAFYAIYQIFIEEVERYKLCALKKLASHTASDLTSRSAGDIEVFDENNKLFEAVEIKHGKKIDIQMIRIVKEKIVKYNPQRYCVFSSSDIEKSDSELIDMEISEIDNNHGCQIIINGTIPTLKYYLRLISSLDIFINKYSLLIEADSELQIDHKIKWNEILSEHFGIYYGDQKIGD
jgi:DNA (cytosine-5)-methyltransferase 1